MGGRNYLIMEVFEELDFSIENIMNQVSRVPTFLKWTFLAIRHWPKDLENAYYISKHNLPKYLEMGKVLMTYLKKYIDMMCMSVKHLPRFVELIWGISKNLLLSFN